MRLEVIADCMTVTLPENMTDEQKSHAMLQIKVHGKPIPKSTQKYHFVLNKPKGYLCANASASDSAERPRLVVDLFQPWLQREWKVKHQHPNAVPPRLFTVGRLDVQTTGLIFVTNDGKPNNPASALNRCLLLQHSSFATWTSLCMELDWTLGLAMDGPKKAICSGPACNKRLSCVQGSGRNGYSILLGV